ncbi:MAG: recombinase family protein [Myxococcaceae bacterium]
MNKPTREARSYLRVGAYARVSTSNQLLEHDSSLDTQFELMRKRAEYQAVQARSSRMPPWKIVGEYREEGRSGKNIDRPELQRLLADVRDGKLDLVCVTKIDRITRSLTDFYTLWGTFEEHDVEFIALNENFDTTNASGRAMLKITLVFAELERERTSERTKEKIQARRQAGLWFGGQVPLGYQVNPKNPTTLDVDERAATMIRRDFFESYLDLGTARSLARHLSRRDIRRPKRKTKRGEIRGGTSFTTQSVLNILRNPVYIAKRSVSDGRLVDCQWKPIVPVELFERVKALLAKNGVDRPTGRPSVQHVFLLEGLFRCGACGSAMSRASGTGRNGAHFYYRCSRRHRTAAEGCKTKDVPVAAVEKFILDQLRQYSADKKAIIDAVKKVNAGRDEQLTKLANELAQARAAQLQVAKQIAKLVDAVEAEGNVEALKARLREREAEQAKLRTDVINLEAKKQVLERETLNAQVVAEGYRRLPRLIDEAMRLNAHEELRGLLQSVVNVIEWRPDPENPRRGEALIKLFELPKDFWSVEGSENKQPSAPLLGGSLGCPRWLPDQDSNLGHGD